MRGMFVGADLSRFKVVYGDKVLRALALAGIEISDDVTPEDLVKVPKFIEVIVINSDGNIEILRDETWRFQFISILGEQP